MAFRVDLTAVRHDADVECAYLPHEIAAARARLPFVLASGETVDALCAVAMALGIASIRAPLLALHVARAAAALAGREVVAAEDASLAGRLVLAPRATVLPATEPAPEPRSEDDADGNDGQSERSDAQPEADAQDTPDKDTDEAQAQRLEDVVLEAAKAALPADLLAKLASAQNEMRGARSTGRVGALHRSAQRGRPAGVRHGDAARGGAPQCDRDPASRSAHGKACAAASGAAHRRRKRRGRALKSGARTFA